MFNIDHFTKEVIKEHNLNWPQIPEDTFKILIVRGPGS